MTVPLQRVRVWDLPTRLFHWVLAAALVGSVITAKVGGDATVWHFRLGYLVFALLHVAAVLFYLWGRRSNLIRPMLGGDKILPVGTPASIDSAGSRLLAAVLLAACAAGVGWVSALGD